jgi:hypothetical protein
VRVFNVYFAKLRWKFIVKADDVSGHQISPEWDDQANTDLGLQTLFGTQAIGKRLKDMQRNCDFSVGSISH